MKKMKIVINEHEIGICKMTKELEDAFINSCAMRGISKDDQEYFREYLFALVALLSKRMEKIEIEWARL